MTDNIKNNVVWSEGMLMYPHHFQQQQKYNHFYVKQSINSISPYHFGITALQIDDSSLKLGQIKLSECECRFANGDILSIPNHDLQPDPKIISADDTNKIIYLAIPINSQYAISDSENNYMINKQIEVEDIWQREIKKSIHITQNKPRILLENENFSGYCSLAIGRIYSINQDGSIALDSNFIPNIYSLNHPSIKNKINIFIGTINNRRYELSQLLTNINYNQTFEIAELMQLSVLNRFYCLFDKILTSRYSNILSLYEALVSFIGDFATFIAPAHMPPKLPDFSQSSTNDVFQLLFSIANDFITTPIAKLATEIKLKNIAENLWTCSFVDQDLDASNLILSVSSSADIESLRKHLPQNAKITSSANISELISKGLPGIPLNPMTTVPRHIVFNVNETYFSLNKQNRIWRDIVKAKNLTIHVSGGYENLSLKLWLINNGALCPS